MIIILFSSLTQFRKLNDNDRGPRVSINAGLGQQSVQKEE